MLVNAGTPTNAGNAGTPTNKFWDTHKNWQMLGTPAGTGDGTPTKIGRLLGPGMGHLPNAEMLGHP